MSLCAQQPTRRQIRARTHPTDGPRGSAWITRHHNGYHLLSSFSLFNHEGRSLALQQVRRTPALGHFCGWSLSQVPSSFTSFFHVFAARSPSQGGLPPALFCTPIALTCSISIHILITVYSYNWLICCVLSIVIPKSSEQCLILK